MLILIEQQNKEDDRDHTLHSDRKDFQSQKLIALSKISIENNFANNQNGKNYLLSIIIYFENSFRTMIQNPRQVQSNLIQTSKRQFRSLKYKQKAANTPSSYSISPINLSILREKQRDNSDKQSDSFDTCQSQGSISTERTFRNPRENKIKVELCKNFVEKGYCPYENRCKFAHGIQELRAKDTCSNCDLYRTRRCKVFFQKHQCKFGQRCNFMHDNRKISEIVQQNNSAIRKSLRMNFQEIVLEGYISRVKTSKLLEILQCGNQNTTE